MITLSVAPDRDKRCYFAFDASNNLDDNTGPISLLNDQWRTSVRHISLCSSCRDLIYVVSHINAVEETKKACFYATGKSRS